MQVANLAPSGSYNWADVNALGGLPVVMKELAKHGLIHTDCLTVSGKTVAENLEGVPDLQDLPAGQDVLFPVAAPWAPEGALVVRPVHPVRDCLQASTNLQHQLCLPVPCLAA
eukprot:SAG22_NODE_1225_length_5115_cov_1.965510_3_plen_113_part_00